MPHVLLTGLAGTGKTTLVAASAAAGVRAVDLDAPGWSDWVDVPDDDPTPGAPVEPGRDWAWRLDRVEALLEDAAGAPLVIAGTSPGMGALLPRLDRVVLLVAPVAVVEARLAARPADAYGGRPGDREREAALRIEVEPLLRRAATDVLDTSAPLASVVAAVLALARG